MSSVINNGSNSVHFWDDVDNTGGVAGEFEHGNSYVTQTIRIQFDDLQTALDDILGTNQVAGDTILRNPPLQHSLFPAYYATKCSCIGGMKPTGKQTPSSGTGLDIATYQYVILRITYNCLPFTVDFAAGHEGDDYWRYCQHLNVPSAEFLKIGTAGIQYKFQSANGAVNDNPVSFGLAKIIQKADLVWRWYHVPEGYIFNTQGIPSKILNGIGKVNDDTYQGYAAGILLMMPPTFEGINSQQADLVGGLPNREFNINFNVKVYDPDIDAADTTRGHNLVPYKNGLFYLAVTKDVAENTLYDVYDFNKFFQKAT